MPPEISNNYLPNIEFTIFDVDNVIIDTIDAAEKAQRALGKALTHFMDADSANRVENRFVFHYNTLAEQAKAGAGVIEKIFATLLGRIKTWQQGVLGEGWELKLWSREVLLAIALEQSDIPVEKEWIEDCLQPYWAALTRESKIRPDAAESIECCRQAGIAIHLATASDGFLDFNDKEKTFFYHPPTAVRRKLDRMKILQKLGMKDSDISIGDPIGKPDERFFSQVLLDFETKLGRKIDLGRTLAIGDNVSDDVLPLLKLGVARGAWLAVHADPKGKPRLLDKNPRVGVVNSLTELENIPWTAP